MRVIWIWIVLEGCHFTEGFFGWTKFYNTHQEPTFQDMKCCNRFSFLESKWIDQNLDHFNPQDNRKWKMRYFEDLNFLEQDGPIFIYLGGEWSISPRSIGEGTLIYEMAQDTEGALFYTEHRFYGQSQPTQNTSTENLRFLSMEQALGDIAYFIDFIKSSNSYLKNSKVIIIGASYSASMAAWMRMKYPHLVDGAFASSGPVHAKIDFSEYKEVMTRSLLRVGGEACRDIIKNAFHEMEELVQKQNTSHITKAFKLCNDLKIPIDVPHFFYEVSDIVAGLIQSHQTGNIERACETMELARKHVDDIEAFAIWIRGETALISKGIHHVDIEGKVSNKFKRKDCLDFSYENSIQTFSNIEWGSLANQQMRQWIYQTCSEFAWFQTSSSKNQIFGSTYGVDYFIRICNDLYDFKFDKKAIESNIQRTNNRFGGFNPDLRNVVFTNGDLDPWHPMSILEDMNESVSSILIPLSAHVSDLGAISENDSVEKRVSKLRVKELILKWTGILNIDN